MPTKENLKKKDDRDEEEEDPDEPVTKCVFQDDLNQLYSGKLVKVFYIYSWFFTNAFVYYAYAGGIPLMYGIGALHFGASYWCYKYLFFRFYSVTFGFDDQIIRYSITFMKWALFFHLLMNLFMYTNKRLLSPDNYNPDEHYRPPLETTHKFFYRRYDS